MVGNESQRTSRVYTVLDEPILLFGVDRRIAIFNAMVTFAMVMSFHWYWWIPVAIIAHIVLRFMHRRDAQIRDVYMVFKRQGTRYDPWWHPYHKSYSGRDARAYIGGMGRRHREHALARDWPC